MQTDEEECLGGMLWVSGGRTGDVEPLLRSFLAKYAITLDRVVVWDGSVDCVVHGPLSTLDGHSIGVVLEHLREWLPQPDKIRLVESNDSRG